MEKPRSSIEEHNFDFQYHYRRQLSKIQEVSEEESSMHSRLGMKNDLRAPQNYPSREVLNKYEENDEEHEEEQENKPGSINLNTES